MTDMIEGMHDWPTEKGQHYMVVVKNAGTDAEVVKYIADNHIFTITEAFNNGWKCSGYTMLNEDGFPTKPEFTYPDENQDPANE